MDRANYFPDQRVTKDDLNYTESSKASEIQRHTMALLTPFNPLSGSIPSNFQMLPYQTSVTPLTPRGVFGAYGNTAFFPSASGSADIITIGRGWGLTDAMEIVSLTNTLTITKGDNNSTQKWISEPSITMYVTVEYQESSSSVGSDSSSNIYYKRYNPSYFVRVSSAYPSGSQQIPVASFISDVAGDIATGTFTDIRNWVGVYTTADGVYIKRTNITGINTLDDHVRAVGTGIASVTNPHAISINDIGYQDTTPTHRRDTHTNGIVALNGYGSQSYSGIVITPGVPDKLYFTNPSNAVAVISGSVYTNGSTSILQATSTYATLGNGDYWVVLTPSGSVANTGSVPLVGAFLPTASVQFNKSDYLKYPQYLRIGQCNVNVTSGLITNYVDYRDWYATVPYGIRADFAESVVVSTGSVTDRTSDLTTTLGRLRYSIGMAATGSGSVWNSSFPLTAGPASNADNYHTHSNLRFGSTITSGSVGYAVDTNYQNASSSSAFIIATIGSYIIGGDSRSNIDVYVGSSNIVPPASMVASFSHQNSNTETQSSWSTGSISFFVPSQWWWRLDSARSLGTYLVSVANIAVYY